MSHAYGKCRFADGTVLHFEYDGTSDMCISRLWDTEEEVGEHWRTWETRDCKCGKYEDVEMAVDYGSGKIATGRACKHCRAVTFDPFPLDLRYYDDESNRLGGYGGWEGDSAADTRKYYPPPESGKLPDWWAEHPLAKLAQDQVPVPPEAAKAIEDNFFDLLAGKEQLNKPEPRGGSTDT